MVEVSKAGIGVILLTIVILVFWITTSASFSSLQSQFFELHSEVNNLKYQVDTLENQVVQSDLPYSINNLESRMDAEEDRLQALQTQIWGG